MILRGVTFVVGLALLSATAHVTISHAGGYATPHALLVLAIAVGVGVAALAIGASWANERRALAAWLTVAIVAGEAFGFLMTGERLIAGREASQAPLRAAAAERAKAEKRVADATSRLDKLPGASARLGAALEVKATADAAAVAKSAERECLVNCRALLQAQVDAAEREVGAARAEIGTAKEGAAKEVAAARAALAALETPLSASPLADRLGVPAWALDLIAAALGSMAANGLAVGLIAFSAHGRREVVVAVVPASAAPAIPLAEHAKRFAFDSLFPADAGAGVDLFAVRAAYGDWCRLRGVEPLPGAAFGRALGDLFDGVGIPVAERDGRLVAMGVRLAAPRALARA